MNERSESMYYRVVAMISPDQKTWDLSPNDVAALKHVLGLCNLLADEVAQYEGGTVPGVLSKYGKQEITKQE